MHFQKKIALVLLAFGIVACQKFFPPNNRPKVSEHGESDSHYTGDNCMNCHYQAGNGEGWYTVAGSSYGQYQNGFVEIYSDQTFQTLLMSIEIDELGNYYTTEEIDVTSGEFYAAVRDAQGNRSYMADTPLPHGQCNACHGTVIEPRIDL